MSQDNIDFCDICLDESCTEYLIVCNNKHKCCSICYKGLKKLRKCHQCRQQLLKVPNEPLETQNITFLTQEQINQFFNQTSFNQPLRFEPNFRGNDFASMFQQHFASMFQQQS